LLCAGQLVTADASHPHHVGASARVKVPSLIGLGEWDRECPAVVTYGDVRVLCVDRLDRM
jgi:hypothetical protein